MGRSSVGKSAMSRMQSGNPAKQPARNRTRHRSYSDPFSDPAHAQSAPRPPPKHTKMPSAKHHRDILDAVRDTVQLTGKAPEQPRTRAGRSQTVVACVSLPSPDSPSSPTSAASQVPLVCTAVAPCLRTPSSTPPTPSKRQRESPAARRAPSMQTSSTDSTSVVWGPVRPLSSLLSPPSYPRQCFTTTAPSMPVRPPAIAIAPRLPCSPGAVLRAKAPLPLATLPSRLQTSTKGHFLPRTTSQRRR